MPADTGGEIRNVVARVLHKESSQVTDDDLRGMDSIGRITLIVDIENTFKVELMEGALDLTLFESINNLAAFIDKKV